MFLKMHSRNLWCLRIYTWHNKIWGINDGYRKYAEKKHTNVLFIDNAEFQRFDFDSFCIDVNFCHVFLIINRDLVSIFFLLFPLKPNKNEQNHDYFALSVPVDLDWRFQNKHTRDWCDGIS